MAGIWGVRLWECQSMLVSSFEVKKGGRDGCDDSSLR